VSPSPSHSHRDSRVVELGPERIRKLAAGRPFVSVLIPARQEEAHIRQTLAAVLDQEVDTSYEVLVIDGRSPDRTREIVGEIAAEDDRVRLLDNPGRIVPTAMNVGIREARGEFVVRVDGHCRIPRDYLREVLAAFRETGSECVGGAMVAEGEGFWGETIGLATSTSFGMGGQRFHARGEAREMDTVYLGAYVRQVLHDIGMYDERFVRNQDDELNYRLRAGGGKVSFTPRIWAAYTNRATLRKLFSQYAQYGFWKVRLYRKHPRQLNPRHLVPAAFVTAIAASLVAGAWLGGLGWLMPAGLLALYFAAATVSSVAEGIPLARLPVVLLAYLTVHLGYGAGFLAGLAAWPFDRRFAAGGVP
jgi:glycosyltransferase involved in cell wall biosynthesis